MLATSVRTSWVCTSWVHSHKVRASQAAAEANLVDSTQTVYYLACRGLKEVCKDSHLHLH
jgi:hypothetical protein